MSRGDDLLAGDRRHLWHPFTAQAEWESEPQLVIESAAGVHLVDTEGRRYIDGVSSLWTTVFGHRVPEIDAAVRAQLERVAHSTLLGLSHAPAIELAERLVALLPAPLARVFYSDDGSTAVEVAVKMAWQFCLQNGHARRKRFLGFTDAYHGDTLGSVSLGGIGQFHGAYRPLLFDVHRAPYPNCYRCPLGEAGDPAGCGLRCAREVERLLERRGEEIAACVVEPRVQGAAGMVVAPPGFLRAVAEACRRRGVLLVADEVATGVCRTGPFLACAAEGVVPDFLCLAKGLSGGYLPIAVTATTEEIYRGFLGPRHLGRTFFHGHTYTGNPLAAAAAAATLDLVRARDLPAHVDRLGPLFDRGLERIRGHAVVGDARRCGVMTGIELVADRETRAPFDPALRVGHRIAMAARRHGAIVRPIGDVVILNPPPAIDPATLEDLLGAVDAAIADVEAEDPCRGAGESRAKARRRKGEEEEPLCVSASLREVSSGSGGAPAPASQAGAGEAASGRLPPRLAITGTDTGAGKTFVGAILARAWRLAGRRVAVAKPVETGVPGQPGGTSDAEVLARAAGDERTIEALSPYRLRRPLAPTVAAEADGVALDADVVRRCVREALAAGDAVLVEGAGGLLVPLAPGLTLRDLAAELDLPLLIVVADRLGCVNHALLTVEAARRGGCRVCGFVLCRTTAAGDESRGTNRALLERLGDAPVLFEVPWIPAEEARDVDALARRVRPPV